MYLIRDSSYCDTSLVIKILAGWGVCFSPNSTKYGTSYQT